jgi:molecular chaperone GrpE
MHTDSQETPDMNTPPDDVLETPDTDVESPQPEIDDVFVASVLDESDGDVAAAIQWLQDSLEETRESRLRALSELRNNQRRAQENETRVSKAARASVIRSMLTVVDQLELALGQNLDDMTAAQFAHGVTLARDEFMKTLGDLGANPIEPALGELFDPLRHEAMLKQDADGVESGHVTMIMQLGFVLGDVVLRPAKVAIAP